MHSGVSVTLHGAGEGADCRSLSVNAILVVGHEKLNVEMQRTYGNRIAVVKIPKSGGVSFRVRNASELSLISASRSLSSMRAIANACGNISCRTICTAKPYSRRPAYRPIHTSKAESRRRTRPLTSRPYPLL